MMGEMLLQMLLRMSGQSTPFVSGVHCFKVAVFNISSAFVLRRVELRGSSLGAPLARDFDSLLVLGVGRVWFF